MHLRSTEYIVSDEDANNQRMPTSNLITKPHSSPPKYHHGMPRVLKMLVLLAVCSEFAAFSDNVPHKSSMLESMWKDLAPEVVGKFTRVLFIFPVSIFKSCNTY